MPWTAPHVERTDPPVVGDERTMLEGFLDFHRQTLLTKTAGLNAKQLRARSAPPSSLTLLGLVRHMSEVERSWFRRRIAGEKEPFIYCTDDNWDADFDEVDAGDPAEAFETYLREVELARKAVAGRSLEETFFHTHRDTDISVRWVYTHMIEEYARHNGHADLLRERIDGLTGE